MAIYDYLPKYYEIEANNLKGLQPGFVVSQMNIASPLTAKFCKMDKNVLGSKDSEGVSTMIANGHIVSIDEKGIKDPEATGPLFIVYNEPLNTVFDSAKFYATDTENECLRLVQLIPGDEWTTNMDYSGVANIAERVKEMDATASDDDWFASKTLPDGTAAKHYVFLG